MVAAAARLDAAAPEHYFTGLPGNGQEPQIDFEDLEESLENVDIECPYCGKGIEIAVDALEGVQEYVEDCQVCCNPITLKITASEDGPFVEVRSQDD